MMPVRLEPATLRSPVKHSTTEPLRSLQQLNELCLIIIICIKPFQSRWVLVFGSEIGNVGDDPRFLRSKDLIEFDRHVSVTKSILAAFARRLKPIRANFSNVSG